MSLSIIIPHFNKPDLLEKLLVSIPQDKIDIQTIVVDDQSETLYLDEVKKLKNKYNFELYQNHIKKSAGLCRNLGLQKAKNNWVIFADGDDYFTNGFYDKVSKYFDKKIDVVFFPPTSQYLDTGKTAGRHLSFKKIIQDYLNDKNKKNELLLRYSFISTWSKMMKKEFMNKHSIKFDEGPMGAEDVLMSTKIGFFMKYFDVCSEVIYCLITRHGSSTRVLNQVQFDIRLNARISRINFLKAHLDKTEQILIKPLIYNKAAELLLKSFKQFGLKKFLKVYTLYRKENIKWFRLIYLNPFKVIRYIFIGYNNYLKNNKYRIKN